MRGLIDQRVSRMINGYFGVVINTGEDNYLRTADAIEAAPSVDRLAVHQPPARAGLGRARRADRARRRVRDRRRRSTNGLLYEWAQAQLTRELFPDCPVKYMPPTRHMDGNLFRTHAARHAVQPRHDRHRPGHPDDRRPTEGIFTPHVHDRVLGLENVDYVFNAARDLGEEIEFKPGGIIQTRAQEVLAGAHALLERIAETACSRRSSEATFGDVPRAIDEGRGTEGIVDGREGYFNPAAERGEAPAGRAPRRELDLDAVSPYADHLGDGLVQMSFTLPVALLAWRRARRRWSWRRRWASSSPRSSTTRS